MKIGCVLKTDCDGNNYSITGEYPPNVLGNKTHENLQLAYSFPILAFDFQYIAATIASIIIYHHHQFPKLDFASAKSSLSSSISWVWILRQLCHRRLPHLLILGLLPPDVGDFLHFWPIVLTHDCNLTGIKCL